jgi:hypothetical protein
VIGEESHVEDRRRIGALSGAGQLACHAAETIARSTLGKPTPLAASWNIDSYELLIAARAWS